MIKRIIIQNYKSIRDLDLTLNQINVLIGSNGAGKSNFISFFSLTKALLEQRLGSFTLEKGGIDTLLHQGRKVSGSLYGLLDFDNRNAFYFTIKPMQSNKGFIEESGDYYNADELEEKNYSTWRKTVWDQATEESELGQLYQPRMFFLGDYLDSCVFHFHDTSASSPMRSSCDIGDNHYLKSDGSNLAAYLYRLSLNEPKAFRLIEGTVKSIAPYFQAFKLRPDPNAPQRIQLEWSERNSDMYLNGYSFSDGTLRFIALATLLLQSKPPKVIIVDEPELGLHPAAITKFAALVHRASKKSQIILSTQSTNLVDSFEPEDIITVDREGGQSVFKRLAERDLSVWLDGYNYSLSELWEKNVIGGQLS